MAEFDVDRVNALLDILLKTKDYPAALPLQQVASIDLVKIIAEVQEQLRQEAEEAKAAAEEEAAAKAEEKEEEHAA